MKASMEENPGNRIHRAAVRATGATDGVGGYRAHGGVDPVGRNGSDHRAALVAYEIPSVPRIFGMMMPQQFAPSSSCGTIGCADEFSKCGSEADWLATNKHFDYIM
jgi:hypothetical protein